MSMLEIHQGFRLDPILTPTSQYIYEDFLRELQLQYGKASHPVTGNPIMWIVGPPHTEDAYLQFDFGKDAIIPFRCHRFVRFLGIYTNRSIDLATRECLHSIYFLARKFFPDRIEYTLAFRHSNLPSNGNAKVLTGPQPLQPPLNITSPETHMAVDAAKAEVIQDLNNERRLPPYPESDRM
ncbi:hypothetical protein PG995_004428 [Apiospora arundinis]